MTLKAKLKKQRQQHKRRYHSAAIQSYCILPSSCESVGHRSYWSAIRFTRYIRHRSLVTHNSTQTLEAGHNIQSTRDYYNRANSHTRVPLLPYHHVSTPDDDESKIGATHERRRGQPSSTMMSMTPASLTCAIVHNSSRLRCVLVLLVRYIHEFAR